jgi:hypothetical protein
MYDYDWHDFGRDSILVPANGDGKTVLRGGAGTYSNFRSGTASTEFTPVIR